MEIPTKEYVNRPWQLHEERESLRRPFPTKDKGREDVFRAPMWSKGDQQYQDPKEPKDKEH